MDASDNQKDAIRAFIRGEIGIQVFMDLTGTTHSGCYSMIARGVRQLFKEGTLKIVVKKS